MLFKTTLWLTSRVDINIWRSMFGGDSCWSKCEVMDWDCCGCTLSNGENTFCIDWNCVQLLAINEKDAKNKWWWGEIFGMPEKRNTLKNQGKWTRKCPERRDLKNTLFKKSYETRLRNLHTCLQAPIKFIICTIKKWTIIRSITIS